MATTNGNRRIFIDPAIGATAVTAERGTSRPEKYEIMAVGVAVVAEVVLVGVGATVMTAGNGEEAEATVRSGRTAPEIIVR